MAVEKRGRGSGRARMAVIPDFKSSTPLAFLKRNVESGSIVYADGLKSFTGLHDAGYKHVPRTRRRRSTPPMIPITASSDGSGPATHTITSTFATRCLAPW